MRNPVTKPTVAKTKTPNTAKITIHNKSFFFAIGS
jgi:hypothetical protein